MPNTITQSQFQATVLGAAIGDAMGCPVEFLSLEQIHKQYGPAGVTDYVLLKNKSGTICAPYTDDTQMSEAVIKGLLDDSSSLDAAMQSIALHFIEWERNPQGGHRAPGNACIQGSKQLAQGIHWSKAGGETAGGCGSVMRAYPFGLFFHDDINAAEEWSVEHSKLTHRDPIALAACASMSVGIALCLHKKSVDDILLAMIEAASRYSSETSFMLEKASSTTANKESTMKNWYEGWAAHEAITLSAYLFKLYSDDPKTAILTAANTPGDSDSIASLVGSLCGAYNGVESLPAHWIEKLERNRQLNALSIVTYQTRK